MRTKYHQVNNCIYCKIDKDCDSLIFLSRGLTLKKYTKITENPVTNIQHNT